MFKVVTVLVCELLPMQAQRFSLYRTFVNLRGNLMVFLKFCCCCCCCCCYLNAGLGSGEASTLWVEVVGNWEDYWTDVERLEWPRKAGAYIGIWVDKGQITTLKSYEAVISSDSPLSVALIKGYCSKRQPPNLFTVVHLRNSSLINSFQSSC